MKKATVFLKGGFGNQLFQFSFAEYLRKNNYKVDINSGLLNQTGKYTPRELILPVKYFGFNEQKYINKKKFEYFLRINSSSTIKNSIFEQFFNDFKYTKENSNFRKLNNKHFFFNGYWKNMEYVVTNKEFIKTSISNNEVIKNQLSRDTKKNYVMIHVRRGDFVKLGWNLDLSYYEKSLNLLKQKFNNINIDIFTDDKEWVEDQKIFYGAKNIFSQESAHKSGKDDKEETINTFSKMLGYSNFITGNSSFAFWAAYLKCNDSSFITVPNPWFKNHNHPTLKMDNWLEVEIN